LNRWNILWEQNGCMQVVIQIWLPLKREDRKGTLLTETGVTCKASCCLATHWIVSTVRQWSSNPQRCSRCNFKSAYSGFHLNIT
jgi:hypothetical protein